MKRIIICMAAVSVILSGCSKKEPAQQQESFRSEVQTFKEVPAAKKAATIPGVMVSGGYWALEESGDNAGKMRWVQYAVPGTTVMIYADGASGHESRDAVRLTDGATRNFVHITFNDQDLWAQDYSIAVNAKPAIVISDKAYLYKKATPADVLEKTIPSLTVVGVINEAEDDSNIFASQYSKIYAYIDNRVIENQFLAKDALTTSSDDLVGLQIYQKLSAKNSDGTYSLTNETARKELNEFTEKLVLSTPVSEALNTVGGF